MLQPNNIYLIILWLLIFHFGCNYEPRDSFLDGYVIKTEYADGKIINEKKIHIDSVDTWIKHTVAQETWSFYNEHQRLVSKQNWFNGRRNGVQIEFYPRSDQQFPSIKTLSFYNFDNREIFSSHYDRQSKIKKISGIPFYYLINKDSLAKQETFEMILFFTDPPGLRTKMTVVESNKLTNERISHQVVDSSTPGVDSVYFANKFTIARKYTEEGAYRWSIMCLLTDFTTGKILDSIQATTSVIVN